MPLFEVRAKTPGKPHFFIFTAKKDDFKHGGHANFLGKIYTRTRLLNLISILTGKLLLGSILPSSFLNYLNS